MKHKVGYNRLGRKAAHRRAMMKNMATSLLRHERIRTTRARAKELRKLVERLITRAAVDSVHNRRVVATTIGDKAVLAKLFDEIGPRFASRPGGYTRILKLGQRQGDAADVVLIELVAEAYEQTTTQPKKQKSRPAPKPKKETEPSEETSTEVESEAAEPETDVPETEESPEDTDATEEASTEAEATEEESTEEDEKPVTT